MEIRLVLVLEDTNDLSIDMPTILERSYKTRETHKLVLVAVGGQSVRFEKTKRKGGKHAHNVIIPIVVHTTPRLDPMACIYFTRAVLELEHIRGCLVCDTHYLRHNRNLRVVKQPYRDASIAGIGGRVAKLLNGDKQRTIVNGTPSSTKSASPESPSVAACICAMFTGRIACAFAL